MSEFETNRTISRFAWFPRRDPDTKQWFWLRRVTIIQRGYRKTVLPPEGLGPKNWYTQGWATTTIREEK